MVTSFADILISGFLHLYPYPYQIFPVVVTALIAFLIFLPFYGIYKLIIRKPGSKAKSIIDLSLKISGIILFTLFMTEVTVSLITIHQVNRQLGFNYATPETRKGELFIITRVDKGKTMESAGLKRNDEVQMWNTGNLYRLLMNNEGSIASFTIVRDNIKIVINVNVPKMNLPLRKASLLF